MVKLFYIKHRIEVGHEKKFFTQVIRIYKEGVISRMTKLPQIDVIREVLKRIDLSGLENLTSSIVKKARENKVFKKGTIDDYTVAAIDGTKLFGSNIKSCPECCRTKLKNGKVHAAHNAVICA